MARKRRRRGARNADEAQQRHFLAPRALLELLQRQADANPRLIGLDVGEKTIGVAVSDGLLMTATPRETLKRGKFADNAGHLKELARAEKAAAFIIGHPVNMDGSDSPRAQAARAFARNLATASGLPVLLWDERLSTAAVKRTMLDADLSRARRDEVVDKLAAAWILQGLLDHLRQLREG